MQPLVAALLLGAGLSRRMGCCKQLLPLDGRPAIVWCLESILAAGIAEITVVVGLAGEEITKAITHLPVTIARNGAVGSDMAQSVRTGLALVGHGASGVLVCLADHPLVTAETYRQLAAEHRERPDAILIPTFRGKRGHPTLFPLPVIAALATLPTLRDVISTHSPLIRLLEVADPAVTEDMDTPADYRRIAARLGACS